MKTLLLSFLLLVVFSHNAKAQDIDSPPVQPRDTNMIFTAVEVEPRFPGSFSDFVKKNQQPLHDSSVKGSAKVFIQFIVERNGSLTNMKILRTPSDIYSAEAIRILKLSPKWKPALQNGKAVRCYYTLPVMLGSSNDE